MNDIVHLGRKSWTAYVGPVLSHLFGLAIACFVASLVDARLAVAAGLLIVAIAAYRLAVIRSCRLYASTEGVWVASGILPWTRGLACVRWRDLDAAVCHNGFSSWLLRSYDVRVTHRFTKSSEIFFSRLHNGHRAAGAIRAMHSDMLSVGSAGRRVLIEAD